MDFQFQRGRKKPRTENRRRCGPLPPKGSFRRCARPPPFLRCTAFCRSLFRTPPKLRADAEGAEAEASADEMRAMPNLGHGLATANACVPSPRRASPRPTISAGCRSSVHETDFVTSKRTREDLPGPAGVALDGGASTSGELPDGVRLHKLVEAVVQDGLRSVPVRDPCRGVAAQPDARCSQVKPGEGFALDAGLPHTPSAGDATS